MEPPKKNIYSSGSASHRHGSYGMNTSISWESGSQNAWMTTRHGDLILITGQHYNNDDNHLIINWWIPYPELKLLNVKKLIMDPNKVTHNHTFWQMETMIIITSLINYPANLKWGLETKKTSAIMSGWICKSSLFTIVAENIVWILHKKVPGSLDKASRNWCFFLRHVSCFPVIGGRPGPVAFCYLLRIKPALPENPTWYCSTSMHVNVISYAFFRCTRNAQTVYRKKHITDFPHWHV